MNKPEFWIHGKTRNSYFKYLILGTIALLLFLPPVHVDSLWWRELINSGHTILFVFLSFYVLSLIMVKVPDTNVVIKYLCVLLICFLAGVVIEVLQTLVHREASLKDIYGNLFGILAGLFLYAGTRSTIKQHGKIAGLLVITAASFFVAGMAPLIGISIYCLERANAFPVIYDVDSTWSPIFTRYTKGKYPGISVIEPEADWSEYKRLNIIVHSTNKKDTKLVVRVNDKRHNKEYYDRFNLALFVQTGLNKIQIPVADIRKGPADRELDLTNIAAVILYSRKLEEWAEIHVGSIYLE